MSADDLDLEAFRERLLARRDALERTRDARSDASKTVELDQQRTGRLSRMDALQGQAMAQASAARADDELRRIQQALARIDSGDFGFCIECDEPIGAGRLGADPAATLCIDCASRRD